MWVYLINTCKYLLLERRCLGETVTVGKDLYCKYFSLLLKMLARYTALLRKGGCKTECYCLFNSKNAIYSLIKGTIIERQPSKRVLK